MTSHGYTVLEWDSVSNTCKEEKSEYPSLAFT